MSMWANKIDADFKILTERKFPQYAISVEKFQMKEYLKDYDWVYFLDADLLIHPDTIDMSLYLEKDVLLHWSWLSLSTKYKNNKIFERDDRRLGLASTFLCVSNWMEDFFDLDMEFKTQEEISKQIIMLKEEQNFAKLVSDNHTWLGEGWYSDEFILAYNLCKYGLKAMAIKDFFQELYIDPKKINCFAHEYLWTIPQKEKMLVETIYNWRI